MPPLEPSLTAMALVTSPPAPPDGVEAKLVTNFDEYVVAFRIGHAAFGVSEDVAAKQLAALPDTWTRYDGMNRFAHLAFIDGEPIGSSFTLAGTIGLVLNGSSVLPEARGRGAYRALVAARWSRAVELEKPALVVQAGSMSARSWKSAASSRSACSTSSTTRSWRLPPRNDAAKLTESERAEQRGPPERAQKRRHRSTSSLALVRPPSGRLLVQHAGTPRVHLR
jgi:GNAT superfamily N-acetyltransferase